MLTYELQGESQPGDYYGVVYRGSLLIPLFSFLFIVLAIAVIWRRRRK